jgi:hypothetical protein
MPLIRFATARDLFDAFPTARQDVNAEPTDARSLDYLKSLADSGEFYKAISFCAYLLPRREAVWWACRCVRALCPKRNSAEEGLLAAAEAWERTPEEDQRLAALQGGMAGDFNSPATWLALAAGWSGGNILLGVQQATAAAPPQQTAQAVRAAVIAAAAPVMPPERSTKLQACIDDAVRIVSGERG